MQIKYTYYKSMYDFFVGALEYYSYNHNQLKNAMKDMNVFDIYAVRVWGQENINAFYQKVIDIYQEHQCENTYLKNCSLYMLLANKMENPHSKVEDYYGLWKKINKDYNMKEHPFTLQKDRRVNIGENSYWYGLAKIPLQSLLFALQLHHHVWKSIYFLSPNEVLLDEENTRDIFHKIFLNQNRENPDSLFEAILHCYKRNEVLMRPFYNLEDISVTFVYNPNVTGKELFKNLII